MNGSSHLRLLSGLKVAALLIGLFALFTLGCRRAVAPVDIASASSQGLGTISGTVRGAGGATSVEGRAVEIVNTETGERQRATITNGGGFSFKVKPGKYRVQVELRERETSIKQPGVMNVNRTDVDAHADIVIGQTRVSRPRLPIKQGDMGLGPPIA